MKRGNIVVACSGSLHIAKSIARKSGSSYAEVKAERFPDTELRITLPNVKGKNVYLVQSFYPGEKDINDKLVEVLFSAYTARETGARKIFLLCPYLAYLREDKRFEQGEAISARILAKLFKIFKKVYVVEPHLHRFHSFKNFFPNAEKVSLTDETTSYIQKNIDKPYILVGPDSESQQWVSPIAKKLNVKYIILKKKRFHSRKVKVSGKEIREKAIIIDDIISTGNTLLEAAKLVKAKQIHFIGMHGIFSENALNKLRKKGKVIVSNSIPTTASKLDCTSELAKIIK